eukprot:scaffold70086_cov49-Attheya_sp.AAC.3
MGRQIDDIDGGRVPTCFCNSLRRHVRLCRATMRINIARYHADCIDIYLLIIIRRIPEKGCYGDSTCSVLAFTLTGL